MSKKFYITTTIPYVNAKPHIGFALETIQADVIARYRRLKGDEVFFNIGTDEHGLKIFRSALKEKKEPQAYCDEYAKKYDDLKNALNLSYNSFIRTTNKHHKKAAQEFWRRSLNNGDIYKGKYETKYCVGCELEKTDSELENGRCPWHPDKELELIDEENYFFKFSRYRKPLLKLYEDNPELVLPDWRQKEIRLFTKRGLKDFSISRLKEKMPWGIEVPDDPDHVMYVWFDALINYISTLGWPEDEKKFKEYWVDEKGKPNAVQVAGKDNLRQQSAMWQAMLMSAGLPNSKQILIHGFITADGQKMSKSLGNVVDPFELVEKYGTDAVRYYLLAELNPFEDGDYSESKFIHRYNGDLANGLGNLVARVGKLAERMGVEIDKKTPGDASKFDIRKKNATPGVGDKQIFPEVVKALDGYRFDEALKFIWEEKIRNADREVNEKEPWKLKGSEFDQVMNKLIAEIKEIAFNLQPFLPGTAEKILDIFEGEKVKVGKALFPRV
jgi:methionyl-tRNA synthetase